MKARRRTWVLRMTRDELVDVLRNGRQLRADLPLAAALRYVKKNALPGDTLMREEPDGLRTAL